MSQVPAIDQATAVRSISVQRLLAQQVAQSQVSFYLDDVQQDDGHSKSLPVPPLLLFSASWLQPLISAYSRLLSILAFGPDSSALFPCKFVASPSAPLGLICRERAIDGSAAGLLRAAIVSRAAQEALGFSLFDQRPQQINIMEIVRQCASNDALPGRALRCQTPDEWERLAYVMNLENHLLPNESSVDTTLQFRKAQ